MDRILLAVLWRVSDGIGVEVFSFGFFLLLGRLLSPDIFGIVAIAGTLIQACQVVLRSGFSMAVLQRIDLQPKHLTAALWGNLGCSIICTLILTGVAWPLSIMQGKAELFPVLLCLTPMLWVSGISWIYQAHLRRALRYDVTAISTFASIIVSGVVGVGLAYAGAGVWSLVGQQLTGASVGLFTLLIGSDRRVEWHLSWQHFRDLLHFASRTSLSEVLDFVSRRMDAVVLGFFLSANAIGLYFVATRLTTTVSTASLFVIVDLTAALLPRHVSGTSTFRDAAYQALQLTSVFCTPTFMGVALISNTAVVSLFGDVWAGAAAPLQIMCISSIPYALMLTGRQVLNAAGYPGTGLAIAAINAALYILVLSVVARYGSSAAAATGGVVSALCLPLVLLALQRRLGMRVMRIIVDQVPVWAATLSMVITVIIVDHLVLPPPFDLGPLQMSIMKGVVGILAFGGALRCFAPALWKTSLGGLRLRQVAVLRMRSGVGAVLGASAVGPPARHPLVSEAPPSTK